MAGGAAAVDVERLAGDERGPLEIEDRVDHVADLAEPWSATPSYDVLCVLITPGATALTRTPLAAYSVASERVTASSPPFVSAASADGDRLSAWLTRLAVTLTTWPVPWATICRIARCVMWKNPARFTAVAVA